MKLKFQVSIGTLSGAYGCLPIYRHSPNHTSIATSMSDDTVTLYCLLDGEPPDKVFKIKVDRDDEIYDLKCEIKKARHKTLEGFDAASLTIRKVCVPLGDDAALERAQQLQSPREKLQPWDKVAKHFSTKRDSCLHLLVQFPGL